MNQFDASKSIEEKLTAASGKPVSVNRDPNCSGHASIKIASDEAPDQKYTLRSLLGKNSGLHLYSIMYATLKRFAPQEDVGIDFSKECKASLGK